MDDPRRARREEQWRRVRRRRAIGLAVLAAVVVGGIATPLALTTGGTRTHPRTAAGKTTVAKKRHKARRHRQNARRDRPVVFSGPPSSKTRMKLLTTIGGQISPKSVDASQHGLVFAQNMMYSHTVTVYDVERMRLVRTIPDSVELARYGFGDHPGVSRGAPVEAAFTPGGGNVYVSNYSMYGAGFGGEGTDTCSPGEYGNSFLYRISVKHLRIEDAIQVGAVPKYVAVTPDGRYVLVSNWCSYDLSVISARTGREVKRVYLGPYPRGIVVSPDSKTAYVAVMGSSDVAKVDLDGFAVSWIYGVGSGPRHLVISPKGRWLYATLNGEGTVAKIDLRTNSVVAKVSTGSAPRSMAIAGDGKSLYVVNYESNTVAKVRAGDMSVVQTVATNASPIGITYDVPSRTVWVACYTGSIMVFKD